MSQVEALTRRKPVLMIFEDAHWTDSASFEAISRMVDRISKSSRPANCDVSTGL